MTEMPTMTKTMYSSNSVSGDMLMAGGVAMGQVAQRPLLDPEAFRGAMRRLKAPEQQVILDRLNEQKPQPQPKKEPAMPTMRIVRVIVVDTNENIPLKDRVVHMGEEQLTDSDDTELFFGLNMTELLAKHNERRVTFKDKKQSKGDTIVMLEPARIRDLTMTVVDVATFGKA